MMWALILDATLRKPCFDQLMFFRPESPGLYLSLVTPKTDYTSIFSVNVDLTNYRRLERL